MLRQVRGKLYTRGSVIDCRLQDADQKQQNERLGAPLQLSLFELTFVHRHGAPLCSPKVPTAVAASMATFFQSLHARFVLFLRAAHCKVRVRCCSQRSCHAGLAELYELAPVCPPAEPPESDHSAAQLQPQHTHNESDDDSLSDEWQPLQRRLAPWQQALEAAQDCSVMDEGGSRRPVACPAQESQEALAQCIVFDDLHQRGCARL